MRFSLLYIAALAGLSAAAPIVNVGGKVREEMFGKRQLDISSLLNNAGSSNLPSSSSTSSGGLDSNSGLQANGDSQPNGNLQPNGSLQPSGTASSAAQQGGLEGNLNSILLASSQGGANGNIVQSGGLASLLSNNGNLADLPGSQLSPNGGSAQSQQASAGGLDLAPAALPNSVPGSPPAANALQSSGGL